MIRMMIHNHECAYQGQQVTVMPIQWFVGAVGYPVVICQETGMELEVVQ